MDKAKTYLQHLYLECIYIFVNIVFMILLSRLNGELLANYKKDDYLSMLTYEGYKPVIYFIITAVLVVGGAFIGLNRIRKLKYQSFNKDDVICTALSLLIVFVIIISLIMLINNPILRAIITAVCAGVVIVKSMD